MVYPYKIKISYITVYKNSLMVFSEREQFICLLLIMNMSKIGKKLDRNIRMAILRFARDKNFPTITDDVWNKMAKDIEKTRADMKQLLMDSYTNFNDDPDKVKDDISALKLDNTIRENMDKINVDDMTKDTNLGTELSEKNTWFRRLKNLKNDYDEKR